VPKGLTAQIPEIPPGRLVMRSYQRAVLAEEKGAIVRSLTRGLTRARMDIRRDRRACMRTETELVLKNRCHRYLMFSRDRTPEGVPDCGSGSTNAPAEIRHTLPECYPNRRFVTGGDASRR
jgi:hypothetical protein